MERKFERISNRRSVGQKKSSWDGPRSSSSTNQLNAEKWRYFSGIGSYVNWKFQMKLNDFIFVGNGCQRRLMLVILFRDACDLFEMLMTNFLPRRGQQHNYFAINILKFLPSLSYQHKVVTNNTVACWAE